MPRLAALASGSQDASPKAKTKATKARPVEPDERAFEDDLALVAENLARTRPTSRPTAEERKKWGKMADGYGLVPAAPPPAPEAFEQARSALAETRKKTGKTWRQLASEKAGRPTPISSNGPGIAGVVKATRTRAPGVPNEPIRAKRAKRKPHDDE